MTDNAEVMIRVLIVDDIAETRENIRKLLQFESDVVVVGAARTGIEAIEMARETEPDVVIMDINMPDMDGITATEGLVRDVPFAQIVMLSVNNDADYVRRGNACRSQGFYSKAAICRRANIYDQDIVSICTRTERQVKPISAFCRSSRPRRGTHWIAAP